MSNNKLFKYFKQNYNHKIGQNLSTKCYFCVCVCVRVCVSVNTRKTLHIFKMLP